MMEEQVASLRISSGDRLLDLGSGTGAFESALLKSENCPSTISVVSVDYVKEALCRARARLRMSGVPATLNISYLDADLDLTHLEQKIPLQSEIFDAAIASLLLSYLDCPELVLEEICRLLRPGGRLSVSSLSHDADFSGLYAECTAELRLGIAKDDLPDLNQDELGDLSRNFLNDAARIIELEESGAFRFWDPEELEALIAQAGFSEIETSHVLGIPPQAFLVSAIKPL
jgi:ubiquinone/menaquinone biosynthesis C-methylase UbiE